MAVRRVRAGEKPSTVIRAYGLCRTTIYKWLRKARRGERALRSTKSSGRPARMSPRQKLQVRRWIVGKDPRQYGFDFGLWTRQIVADLIEQRLGIRLGVTAIGKLLSQLDITPQKPLRRAYERDAKAIERWKKEEFPRLKARARAVGADIFFLDEAGIRSDVALARTWGLRGKTPVVHTSGQRQQVSAISAVTARGAFWFDTSDRAQEENYFFPLYMAQSCCAYSLSGLRPIAFRRSSTCSGYSIGFGSHFSPLVSNCDP
jgi:transposase